MRRVASGPIGNTSGVAREYTLRAVRSPWTSRRKTTEETRRLNLASVIRTSLYALPGPLAYSLAMSAALQLLLALRGKWAGPL